jgi:hypothetical protein
MADETADNREAQLKAAYIFNFVKFVEWLARPPTDAIRVCFSGAPSVHGALAAATVDKEVSGRRIAVRSLGRGEPMDECEVLYIDGESAAIEHVPVRVLTIGDAKDFTRGGGVIQLYTESNRLRFVVNVDNAKRAGLQVSSHLLKLATRVEQELTP